MIGMRSNPQQDLQELQPELQSMPQPMPQPMMQSPQPMPNPMPTPQMSPAGGIQGAVRGVQNAFNDNMNGQSGIIPSALSAIGYKNNQGGIPSFGNLLPIAAAKGAMGGANNDKKSIVKKAVKKAGGKPSGAQTKDQGVMKWMMDYLNKRHETSLNHEREVLKSILEEQRQRGGAAPESMMGHEQEYYDNVRNTGNLK